MNRENNVAKTKKKSVLPKSKVSQSSTPRTSRPTLTPIKTLASAPSTKKANSSSLPKKQIASGVAENKKVANRSLHMSMSLGPSNPDPVPHTTMRKSLIMEQMGDKDIVKRAFKTFQNKFNQPKASGEVDRSSVTKQVIGKNY